MLYRNENTGDVIDTADFSKVDAAEITGRPNWHKVTKAEADIPLHEWKPAPEPVDAPEVSSAMDNDLLPEHQEPGPVDVAQDGEAGSKAVDSPKKAAPGEQADKAGQGTGRRR